MVVSEMELFYFMDRGISREEGYNGFAFFVAEPGIGSARVVLLIILKNAKSGRMMWTVQKEDNKTACSPMSCNGHAEKSGEGNV